MLVSAGVHWQPFSDLALAELPQVAEPQHWQVPAEELKHRLDLRGEEYCICSIDPPGMLEFMFSRLLSHHLHTMHYGTI